MEDVIAGVLVGTAVYLKLGLPFLGIPLNILSIIVLHRDDSFKHTTRFLLQMLAVADILFLVADFVSARFYFEREDELLTNTSSIISFPWSASVWTVVIVTGERYVAITRPL